MSVKIRQRVYRKTNTVTWQADIHVKLLDGRHVRERCRVPGATSQSAALKWARERERWLILHGHEKQEEEQEEQATPIVPTLAEFCRRGMTEYVVANRLKPSTIYEGDRDPLPAPCYPQRSGSAQISPGSSHALSTPA